MAEIFLRETGVSRGGLSGAPPDPKNALCFETEELLRRMSFIDRCLNADAVPGSGGWEEANARIAQRLETALLWDNEYISETVALYRAHRHEQDDLRGRLIRLTNDMYVK